MIEETPENPRTTEGTVPAPSVLRPEQEKHPILENLAKNAFEIAWAYTHVVAEITCKCDRNGEQWTPGPEFGIELGVRGAGPSHFFITNIMAPRLNELVRVPKVVVVLEQLFINRSQAVLDCYSAVELFFALGEGWSKLRQFTEGLRPLRESGELCQEALNDTVALLHDWLNAIDSWLDSPNVARSLQHDLEVMERSRQKSQSPPWKAPEGTVELAVEQAHERVKSLQADVEALATPLNEPSS